MDFKPDRSSGMMAALDRFEARINAILDAHRDDLFEFAARLAARRSHPPAQHDIPAEATIFTGPEPLHDPVEEEEEEVAVPEGPVLATPLAAFLCPDPSSAFTPPTCNVIGKAARSGKEATRTSRSRIPLARFSALIYTPVVPQARKPPDKS